MELRIVELPEFKVVGIVVRTTNEGGKSRADISELWKRFYREDVKNKIQNRIDDEIIGLYTDYEGDFTKPYTMVIGFRVNDLYQIPDGMVGKVIPAAKYSAIKVKGKLPDELVNTWKQIWSSDLHRAYTADFEVYGEKAANREDAEMEVYISIR